MAGTPPPRQAWSGCHHLRSGANVVTMRPIGNTVLKEASARVPAGSRVDVPFDLRKVLQRSIFLTGEQQLHSSPLACAYRDHSCLAVQADEYAFQPARQTRCPDQQPLP
jgi:hypothetical protein